MGINKYMRTALKALSNMYLNVDIKKNYKLIRLAQRAVKQPRMKLLYKTRDFYIKTSGHNIPVRIFSPANTKIESLAQIKYPVIIFFHGGGWITGDLETYERTCMTIARQTGHAIVAVDYRLAPENPFPSALEDCYKAVKAVMRWHRLSGSANKITLMGDSAGGNLAAAVSLYMRDRGEKTADRQILIYPATNNNHTGTSPFPSVLENGTDYILTSKHICDYIDLYCRTEKDRASPYCAPLLAEDFSNQPDTLIITAQYDPLRDEGEEYGRRLKEAGNSVIVRRIEDAMHGYFSLSIRFSAVRESYDMINQFLRDF
jgi:acetyl esterase/lipase